MGIKRSRRLLSGFAALLGLLAGPRAEALTDEEVFRTLRFNFINPGGRAGAMGGAFVGIADDATAAAANPAGLTNLISPELFLELRLEDTKPTRVDAFVDDPRGIEPMVLTQSLGNPADVLHSSFLSYVHPFKNWVIGLSRQELLNLDVEAQNLFTDAPKSPTTEIVRADGTLQALVESYNLSFGVSAGDWFAAGVTGSYAKLSLESSTQNFFNFGSGLESDYATVTDDVDESLGWAVGLLFKPADVIHVGLVYRDGPEFDVEESILDTRPAGNYPSAGVLADYLGNRNLAFDPGAPGGIAASTFDDPLAFENHFEVPDQYGIGLGIHPTQAFTIAIDVLMVEYSDLGRGLVGNVNALTFPGDAGDPGNCDLASPNPDGSFPCEYVTPLATYVFDDEWVWHLGLEYIWTINEKVPFALRGGVYSDPNVRLRADFGPAGVFIADDATFPEGEEELHYTLGFGFVLHDRFQADFAADHSELSDTYTASIIYHF